MKKEERRRVLDLKITGYAQRYFIILQFVILALAMLYLLYLVFGTLNSEFANVKHGEGVELGTVLDEISLLLLVRITLLFTLVFIVNLLLGLFFLHHLTGPLVRIRYVLSQIAEGTVPPTEVVLRKGDFPTDVATALSRALRQIRQWHRNA